MLRHVLGARAGGAHRQPVAEHGAESHQGDDALGVRAAVAAMDGDGSGIGLGRGDEGRGRPGMQSAGDGQHDNPLAGFSLAHIFRAGGGGG